MRLVSEWIDQHVTAGSEPREYVPGVLVGHLRTRHETAPHHRAGETRLLLAKQQRPHARIQPVRTNEQITADHLTAFELDANVVIGLLEIHHAASGADGLGRK